MKHFLKETDFQPHEIAEIFSIARMVKKNRGRHVPPTLDGQTWAMIFSKSSTRTRVSFEVAIRELGGNALYLNKNDIQLGRGESIRDSARVLSRYLHGLVVRTYDHSEVEELARYGTVPVINALTDFLHPCQIYADGFTLAEQWARGDDLLGALKGRKIAFLGDTACNVANSWILGAHLFGMELVLAGPESYAPGPEILALLRQEGIPENFVFTTDPAEAVRDADVVYTDVWVSMGKEDEARERIALMMPYQVNAALMKLAKPDAVFLHCLPAYVGKEVTKEVIEGPASRVWDQAENRMHAQKAILSVLAKAAANAR
jgi:ornithine carbamoyltransferase